MLLSSHSPSSQIVAHGLLSSSLEPMPAPHTLSITCGELTRPPDLLSEDRKETFPYLSVYINTPKDSCQHSSHLANKPIDTCLAPKVGELQTFPSNSTIALTRLLQQTSVCMRASTIGHEHSPKTVGQVEGVHYSGCTIPQRERNPLVQ
jgi:hypothetical protein